MPLVPSSTETRFATSAVAPPYEGIVVIHSSRVTRMGIEALFADRGQGLAVVGSFASSEAARGLLAGDRALVAIVESQIAPGGALALVARGVREGTRIPVVALLGTDERATIPIGFCQAAVRVGGDSHQLREAVSSVAAGGTHLGQGLHHRRMEPDVSSHELLTPREVEMLREIAFGGTSKQLAATHMLSYETVKTHVASAMRKLGASTRAHAVAIGYERGLLGPTPPLLIKSSIVWTRHREVMVFDTFAEAASDVLHYLYDLCGFETWMLNETIGDHLVSLESHGALPPAVMRASENLCSIVTTESGPIVIDDVRAIDVNAQARALFERLGIRSYLCVPIARGADGAVHAGLCAFSSVPRTEPLTADQVNAVVDSAALLSAMVRPTTSGSHVGGPAVSGAHQP